MKRILAISNQKGGVGKTTTAINLASALAFMKQKVLLIDMDPQGNASAGLGIRKYSVSTGTASVLLNHTTIADAIQQYPHLPNLDIIPACLNLIGLPIELVNAPRQNFRLKDALQKEAQEYDYVILDCPSALDLLTINALTAAHSILIPLQAEYLALEGIHDLLRTIHHIRQNLNTHLTITGIIMTMVNQQTNLSQEVVSQTQSFFGEDLVFESMINRNILFGEAPSHGLPIHLYSPRSNGSNQYTQVAKEFLFREGKLRSMNEKFEHLEHHFGRRGEYG